MLKKISISKTNSKKIQKNKKVLINENLQENIFD